MEKKEKQNLRNIFESSVNAEDTFRIIFNGSADGIFFHNPDTSEIIDVNERALEMFGCEKEYFIGKTLDQLYSNSPPYTSKEAVEFLTKSRNNPQKFEWHARRKDGSSFLALVNISTLKAGEKWLSVAMVRDISLRCEADDALIKEKNFTDALLNSIPGLIYMYDSNGHLVRWNKKHEELTGYSAEELSKMSLTDWYKGDQKTIDHILSRIQIALRDGYADAEAWLQKKDGSKICYYFTAVKLIFGGEPYIVGAGINITERKQREESLAQSEAEFRSLFETSPTGSVIFIDRHFVKMSRRFLSMIGYSEDELVGKSTRIMYPDDETFVKVGIELYGAIEKTGFGKVETVLKRKDGNLIDVILNANPLNPEKHAEGISSVFEDITERKNYEKELIQREAELRSLFEASPTGAAMVVNRTFKKVSSQFVKILGYSVEELQESSARLAYVSDDEYEKAGKELYQIDPVSGIGRTETRLKCKNGQIMDVVISSCPLNPKNLADGVCVVFEDITEKKRKSEELVQRGAEYRSLFETSPTGAVTVVDRKFRKVSKRFLNILGYSEEEMIGKSTRFIYSDDAEYNRVGNELNNLVKKNGFARVEAVFRRKTGELINVFLAATPLDPDNPDYGISGVIEDITEFKRMSEALEKRLIALTKPLEGVDVSFEELFDINAIQHLQDVFAESFGVASIISKPDGTPITAPSNFCDLCRIIRNTEKGLKNCIESDSVIGRLNLRGSVTRRCLSGGLLDGGASISVGGHHIANWLIGQLRDESLSDKEMISYAREIGADENEFKAALKKIPQMPDEKFKKISAALFEIANQLSTIAYQNIQQARLIVELKNTEISLQQFRYSIDKAFDAVFWASSDGSFAYVNEQACQSLGYSSEELYNLHVWDLDPRYDENKWNEYWETQDKQHGRLYETHYRKKDGTLILLEIASSYFEGTNPLRIEIARDIGERKRAEERYRIILQTSMDGFSIMDNRNVFIDVNEAFCRLIGYNRDELIGKKIEDIGSLVGSDSNIHYLRSIMQNESMRYETVLKNKNGQGVDVEVSIYHFKENEDLFFVFIRDITARKKYEERIKSINIDLENRVELRTIELQEKSRILTDSLKQLESAQHQLIVSERMAAIGSLVAGVAHEINTPLGIGVTAASYIEIATSKLKHDIDAGVNDLSKLKLFAGNMNESAVLLLSNLTKAAELVQSFKQVAVDQTSGEKRTFNLRDYLENIIQSLHPYTKKYPIKIIIECPDYLIVDTYPGGLSQVITNLVNNSIIHAFPVDREEIIKIRILFEYYHLVIEYSDNGKGISPEIIDKIYDPFFTTKRNEGGSGLGLHIVFKIVAEQMHGEIICKSKIGEGSSFSMRFLFKEVGLAENFKCI
jgi:PAS domain S-box-containing protein